MIVAQAWLDAPEVVKAGATQVCIQPLHPDNDAHPDLKAVEAFARLKKPLRIDPRASTTKAS
jgi:hypothetical protein